MNIEEFNYELPKELIAQRPANPCTHSKLMVLEENKITHKKFYEIIDYFREGDVIVLNETKVLKVKLSGHKESGGKIELMLDGLLGHAVVKGKLNLGQKVLFDSNIEAIVLEKEGNKFKFKFNMPIKDIMEKIGELPTPPYIKEPLESDEEYQNVFAQKDGSIACPTAGLHFDEDLLKKTEEKGVTFAKVCLHVSWDTFLPVQETDLKNHQMHGEYCEIDSLNANIINKAKRLFVVGTTALRALESLSKDGKVIPQSKVTEIFIYPGYKFNLDYSGLITNFHLPKSTLLMMISAFYGQERIFNAYKEAVKEKYRFYSLGDAMLLLKENSQPQ